MKTIYRLLLLFIAFFACSRTIPLRAQAEPINIKYTVMGIHALRHYPFTTPADSIMMRVIERKDDNSYTNKSCAQYQVYQKTSVDLVANKEYVEQQYQSSEQKNDLLFRYLMKPFRPWLQYARPASSNSNNLDLTTLLYEDCKTQYENPRKNKKGSLLHATRSVGLFEIIGQQNIANFLDEIFGEINLYQNRNDILLLTFKSPLASDALETYSYFLSGQAIVEGENCLEIAFYSQHVKENAFAGYLYISNDGQFSLVKATFTLNNAANMNFLKDILIEHSYSKTEGLRVPKQKTYAVMLGDGVRETVLLDRTQVFSGFSFTPPAKEPKWKNRHENDYKEKDTLEWLNYRPISLTPSQTQIGNLVKEADNTSNFRNFQNALLILLNNHFIWGGAQGSVEIGPLTQMISYNNMEGFRIRLGGNNTLALTDRLVFGGYMAYGTNDKDFKYRANLTYSLLPRDKYIWEYPKRLFSFSYVHDLNIPGQDLLTTNRDNIAYSFNHASINNMSLQKIGVASFENEFTKHISLKLGGKYTYDQPKGVVQYMQVQGADTTIINHIETAEIQLSLRFAPGEKFIQNREKRIPIRRGEVELNLNHRIGIQGVMGSDYNYQITDFSAYKKFDFPRNVGTLDVLLNGGKVWNRVPFPLLFIPAGNQSYIFETNNYNCMNFYEFTTDNFVAGHLNCIFNWSPFNLINKNSKIKTSLGARAIYGPLSDMNNPALHPELFVFNSGVKPLDNTPYVEVNVGLANLFKILRIEYARRLTYLEQEEAEGGHSILNGSILVSGSFSF